MTRPFVNLGTLPVPAEQGYAVVGETIGARRLGSNLTVLQPGEEGAPFHNHRINEETFLILEGEGVLRFGAEEYRVGPLDMIACPPHSETMRWVFQTTRGS